MTYIHGMDISEVITAGGGVKALGAKLGIAHTSVIGWRQAGRIPAERCLAVSQATGIPLHELRPDIYPAPTDPARPFLSATALPAPNTGSKPGSPAMAAGTGSEARDEAAPIVSLPPNPDRAPGERAGLTPQQAEEAA